MTSSRISTSFLPGELARPAAADSILAGFLWVFAAAASALIGVILLIVFWEALPALRSIGLVRFLTDADWNPTSGRFDLVPIIAGTFLTAMIAILASAVLGLLSAIFCCFYAPPVLAACYQRCIEILAGIPSVVIGFWGLTVLVPIIAAVAPPGPSLLAAAVVLTIMVLPTIALIASESLRNVPKSILLGAEALALPRWAIVIKVAVPAARTGLLAGVVLGTGRAIGETMAVMMVSGNIVQIPSSIADPVRTLASNIALEIAYAEGLHRSSLFVSGLLLAAVVLATFALLEWLAPDRS